MDLNEAKNVLLAMRDHFTRFLEKWELVSRYIVESSPAKQDVERQMNLMHEVSNHVRINRIVLAILDPERIERAGPDEILEILERVLDEEFRGGTIKGDSTEH
jgi:hypothetical protein